MSHPSDSFDLFAQGPGLLRKSVAGLDAEQLRLRPIAGKWSTLEVICHLVDSEQAWCHRMKRVIAEDRPLLVGYDESRFTATLNYHSRDAETELNLFEMMRNQMAKILQGIPPVSWARGGIHTERGLINLEEMVRIEAEHVTQHIAHIVEKRRALGLGV